MSNLKRRLERLEVKASEQAPEQAPEPIDWDHLIGIAEGRIPVPEQVGNYTGNEWRRSLVCLLAAAQHTMEVRQNATQIG